MGQSAEIDVVLRVGQTATEMTVVGTVTVVGPVATSGAISVIRGADYAAGKPSHVANPEVLKQKRA